MRIKPILILALLSTPVLVIISGKNTTGRSRRKTHHKRHK